MKIELGDVSGLPDAIKALVVEADNKKVLDLSQLAPAAEVERFKGKALTAEQEAIERRKALKAYEPFGTPQDISEKLAKGADPAIVQQLQAKLEEAERGYKDRLGNVLRAQAMAELKAELSKAGVVPEGLDLLAAFAAPRITFDDEGQIRVLSEDGRTPMIGKGANGGATLADLAGKMAGAIPHLVADKGAGGGGKPTGGAGAGSKTITRADFQQLPPLEQAGRIKDGFVVID